MSASKDTGKSPADERNYKARVNISGAGVMHVSSSEIIKTKEARRQINALRTFRDKLKSTQTPCGSAP